MSKKAALERLLRPKSVAVIGGDSGAVVIRQCRAIGFAGEIWAVNPHRADLAGIPCVASVAQLPAVPDAAFVAAPPAASLEIVRELANLGATGAVCFAAGFAETGQSGADLQQRLIEAAGDMAIIGPNCYGFLNYLDGAALWPDQHGGRRVERGVALVSQSGNIALNLTMQQRGLDIAYVVSIGNDSVLGLHEYIDMLLDDERVTAIGLHVEGLSDVAEFSRAAIAALCKRVPIVALKAGRSRRGAAITMSHTASIAGSDRLYSALFGRLGIARCDTLPQYLETLKLTSQIGALPDDTAASMSCSGGDAAIVADSAESLGIRMPAFAAPSVARLEGLLGPNVSVGNPLDYHLYAWGDYETLTRCFTEVLGNGFACTLLVLDYPLGGEGQDEGWRVAERALTAAVAETGQRAVIVSSLPETMPAAVRERLKEAGIPAMQGIEDCLYALRAAALIGAAQRDAAGIRPVMAPSGLVGEAQTLDEWAAKKELQEFGVTVPEGRVCTADDTASVAERIGFPVALKGLSRAVAHKTEAGLVALGLADGAAVRAATRRMTGSASEFLVEKMAGPAVCELIVGVHRDATFGLALLLGAGGTLVELLDDTVSLLLPVSRADIRRALESRKAGKLIAGYRGRPGGDVEAILDAVQGVARYAVANAHLLVELDVNPLVVTTDGAIAADALIRRIREAPDA